MKQICVFLILCFSVSLKSQNYHLFPGPSDTLAFANSSGIISHAKFDSVITSGNDISYYPVGEYVINLSNG